MYQRLTLFSATVIIILSSCSYNDFGELQIPENEDVIANIDIAMLHGKGVRVVDVDCIIRGCVTAEDRSGNFYRSFILQDKTGAIEVRAGFYDLNTIFPRNNIVAIKAKDLAVGTYEGVLQIGRLNGKKIDFIANRYYPDRFFYPQAQRCEVVPREISIDEIEEEFCGELVRILDLHSIDTEDVTWSGERIFTDRNNNEIHVVTSEYARFASDTIPHKTVTITGILMTNKRLKPRDLNDVEI